MASVRRSAARALGTPATSRRSKPNGQPGGWRMMRGKARFVLGLTAVLLLSALAPATASAGLVTYGEFRETEKEHAEFQAFANCPFPASTALDCSWAKSSYKEQFPTLKAKKETEEREPLQGIPSEFKAGNVTVPLRSSITLRGGIGLEEELVFKWFDAEGAETIQAVPQPTLPLTQAIDTSLLSPSELARYNYFVKVGKETKVTATVEQAGPGIQVNLDNLLGREGSAFTFPVKVKLSNPFLGSSCDVGSDTNPIVVELTTGTSGSLKGKVGSIIKFDRNEFILTVFTDTLVNETFASPGVEGCGVEGGADAAINSKLGLPSPAGHNLTVLNGTLKLVEGERAKEGLEGKI
jgi:hypothetical protein